MIYSTEIKNFISAIGYLPEDGVDNIYFKKYPQYNNYIIRVNFNTASIEYRENSVSPKNGIQWGDTTTSNFKNSENFVVLECIDRLLEKGYSPKSIYLEYKFPLGRNEKGKLDILVFDNNDKAYLMIECKTWGAEFTKEEKKMLKDGGQLFSYFVQDKATQYLCLYTSRLSDSRVEWKNNIIKVDEAWSELNNQKEIYDHWNKNTKDNGIFEDWANAYDVEIKALVRGRLLPLTKDDSGKIFNYFAEILRHNVVSDKPNAFNKILNLFICKIIDEDRNDDEQLDFQWLDDDTDQSLQLRLNDLYKKGMHKFLDIDVTDYTEKDINDNLINITDSEAKKALQQIFVKLRLQKNPEFAFIEVYDDASFKLNARVVREVVELLQPYRFRYSHKQQFLGDFFEKLLNTSMKQEAGQFFTPTPIAHYIISCLPIKEMIIEKLNNSNSDGILPTAIDFACGTGHFLTEYMDMVQNIIEGLDAKVARPTDRKKLNYWCGDDGKYEWAGNYVYGIDADYRLIKSSKVSSFLNGDGEANIIRANGLGHFKKSKEYKNKLTVVANENSMDNGQFDVLIANPPYSVNAFKSTVQYGEESFELFNKLTDNSSEIECLFVERMKQLLKVGGYAGIILPSSILNNSGIYTATREIILKYFYIVGITEFGSNTFMATGTNTVTLFLKRRDNSDWKKIETAVTTFFDKPKDFTVLGIEKAFSKYVNHVFDGIELEDYISFISRKPSESFKNLEIFKDYIAWFNSLTEVVNLSTKEHFKALSEKDRKAYIENLFYEKVLAIEKEKLLFFLLAYPQKTVIINTGEKQAEKDFLGYEFSNRRGSEGIKMLPSGTKLYDETGTLNPEKANYYIYNAFNNAYMDINEIFVGNISIICTYNMLDYSSSTFEKTIMLNNRRKINFNEIWKGKDVIMLNELAFIEKGSTITKVDVKSGDIPVVAGGKEAAYYHNASNRNGNVITISASGVNSGYVNYWDGPIFASDCNTVISKDENIMLTKFLYECLKYLQDEIYLLQRGQAQPHVYASDLSQIRIPVMPIDIQEKIVAEVELLEQQIKCNKSNINKFYDDIEKLYQDIKAMVKPVRLSKIIKVINGGTPDTSKPEYWNGGIPWLSIADFKSSHRFIDKSEKTISELGFENSSTNMLSVNDIIISARGTVGAIAQVKIPMAFNQSCYGICGNANIDNGFLYYALKFEIEQLKNNSYGAVFDAITTKTFDDIFVPYPTMKKQKEFIAKVEIIETELQTLEMEILNAEEQMKNVLTKYLN